MEIECYTDREIVHAILSRNSTVTTEFLYRKCYPLFASMHAKYYTDCETTIELINEIYAYIITPHKGNHNSKLQDFGFRCSLTLWLKIVTENYCHQLFVRCLPVDKNNDAMCDRTIPNGDSFFENSGRFAM